MKNKTSPPCICGAYDHKNGACLSTTNQSPDIWLQENEMRGKFDNCACRLEAEHRDPGDNGSPAFFMCPLHRAAPQMLELLRRALPWLATSPGNPAILVDRIKRAIARAGVQS